MLGQEGAEAGHEGGDGRVADEGRLARDTFVENQGQAVDIGLAVEDPALDLFGGGVAGRAQNCTVGFRPGRFGQRPGQTEVGDAQAAVCVEEDVGRLDVSVDETPAVGVVESGAGLDADPHCLFGSEEHPGVVDLAQRAAGQVLEHQVRLAGLLAPVIDPQNVRVVEGSDGAGFGPEPLEEGLVPGEGRVEDLDGHLAVERDVIS